MENGVCVRIIGNITYLNPELRKQIGQIVLMTENNNKCFLNIAFSYSCKYISNYHEFIVMNIIL